MRPLTLVALLVVAGCAYDPGYKPGPDLADTSQYRKDLVACREQAAGDADKVVARHGYTWVIYWISYPLEKRHQLRACLTARGYVAAT